MKDGYKSSTQLYASITEIKSKLLLSKYSISNLLPSRMHLALDPMTKLTLPLHFAHHSNIDNSAIESIGVAIYSHKSVTKYVHS